MNLTLPESIEFLGVSPTKAQCMFCDSTENTYGNRQRGKDVTDYSDYIICEVCLPEEATGEMVLLEIDSQQ